MAPIFRNVNGANGAHQKSPVPNLWITGLGSQYPRHLLGPERLDDIAKRFYDVETPGLKKLLQINGKTGIETRASVSTWKSGFACDPNPPTIDELDSFFRTAGVNLTAQACRKALAEWGGSPADITHTVAVTCTNQGNPGYDLLVARELGLSPALDRMLLHGVGCAGGMSIMRAAAQIACGAAARGRPARVLCFACELCTPNVRHDLAEAEACTDISQLGITAALFGDGAGAFVLCNDEGLLRDDNGNPQTPVFQLLEWGNSTLPDTMQYLSCYVDPTGFRTVLTRDVPSFTRKAVAPMFQQLLPSFRDKVGFAELDASSFDWALHPGGLAIIEGVQAQLSLTDEQLRATQQIYKTRGNTSSASVLSVLDLLRKMGRGKDHVVATAFGPGISIEMAMLRRVRERGD